MYKRVFIFIITGAVALSFGVSDAYALPGMHQGEKPPLLYWIEYHNAEGVTSVGSFGIIYNGFDGFFNIDDGTILPEQYFGGYNLYYAGHAMSYSLHIKNESRRTYRNLRVIVIQEFLNEEGGAGEVFITPEEWFIERLSAGEEIVLEGNINIPELDDSGIDQTHLMIFHDDKGAHDGFGPGQLMLDDPQAGLWCPVR